MLTLTRRNQSPIPASPWALLGGPAAHGALFCAALAAAAGARQPPLPRPELPAIERPRMVFVASSASVTPVPDSPEGTAGRGRVARAPIPPTPKTPADSPAAPPVAVSTPVPAPQVEPARLVETLAPATSARQVSPDAPQVQLALGVPRPAGAAAGGASPRDVRPAGLDSGVSGQGEESRQPRGGQRVVQRPAGVIPGNPPPKGNDLADQRTPPVTPALTLDIQPVSAPGARPPVLEAVPQPEYPQDARLRGVEGTVLLHVRLCRDKRVQILAAEETPAGFGFEDAARRAVERLVFDPAQEAGLPTDVEVRVTVTFRVG